MRKTNLGNMTKLLSLASYKDNKKKNKNIIHKVTNNNLISYFNVLPYNKATG